MPVAPNRWRLHFRGQPLAQDRVDDLCAELRNHGGGSIGHQEQVELMLRQRNEMARTAHYATTMSYQPGSSIGVQLETQRIPRNVAIGEYRGSEDLAPCPSG